MTLPPVVSDPEVCAVRMAERVTGMGPPLPHDWRFESFDTPTEAQVLTKVCRYCGDRKPDNE